MPSPSTERIVLIKKRHFCYFIPLETSGTESRSGVSGEVVLYQGDAARRSHRHLFSLDEACYRSAGDDMVGSVLSVDLEDVFRLHISAGWEAIVCTALWSSAPPPIHEVISLLKKAGAADEELEPFITADVRDLFPWLYYGNRFDVLRKICNLAKAKTESKLGKRKLLVYCHLVAEEAEKIVASNL
jgi:hypothetical protein